MVTESFYIKQPGSSGGAAQQLIQPDSQYGDLLLSRLIATRLIQVLDGSTFARTALI